MNRLRQVFKRVTARGCRVCAALEHTVDERERRGFHREAESLRRARFDHITRDHPARDGYGGFAGECDRRRLADGYPARQKATR